MGKKVVDRIYSLFSFVFRLKVNRHLSLDMIIASGGTNRQRHQKAVLLNCNLKNLYAHWLRAKQIMCMFRFFLFGEPEDSTLPGIFGPPYYSFLIAISSFIHRLPFFPLSFRIVVTNILSLCFWNLFPFPLDSSEIQFDPYISICENRLQVLFSTLKEEETIHDRYSHAYSPKVTKRTTYR